MTIIFILLSIFAFSLAVLFAVLGAFFVSPSLIEEDVEMLANMADLPPTEIIKELWLLAWDTRETLVPSAIFFAIGTFCMILAHIV